MRGTDPDSDEALIERMRAGDDEAFRALFERYAGVLSTRVRRIVPQRLDRKVSIADVVQEACIVAHGQMREFRSGDATALRTWLFNIVELKAREALRRHDGTAMRAAGREVSRDDRLETSDYAAAGPSPSEDAIASELADAARRAMESLPEDYRRVLHLARAEGLSLGEAAERMGRSREATKKLYARALAAFTKALSGGSEAFGGR
jgi:RNA polymerase sigma-70 factor (ECF subfamily)